MHTCTNVMVLFSVYIILCTKFDLILYMFSGYTVMLWYENISYLYRILHQTPQPTAVCARLGNAYNAMPKEMRAVFTYI